MLGQHCLVVDTFCEMYPALESYADETFWDLAQWLPRPNCVLVLSRQALNQHYAQIKIWAEQQFLRPVLVNPTEGSQTMLNQCAALGLLPLIKSGQMLVVGCGDMEPGMANLWYDTYRHKPFDYTENIQQCQRSAQEIYQQLNKPYKFLFLNGRTRAHRKYLLERLRDLGLLASSLWTWLDTSPVPEYTNIYGDICRRPNTVQTLPAKYEVERYRSGLADNYQNQFVKNELFLNEWGEIYIQAEPYIDTYFSVVSETVFEYPYTLRSEKTYKPIAAAHPFVISASRGFYRDLRSAGFRTFDHLIDESFDLIDNDQDRLERTAAVIQDLCSQDLGAFLVAARDTCVYNQQYLQESGHKIRTEFAPRFQAFLDHYDRFRI